MRNFHLNHSFFHSIFFDQCHNCQHELSGLHADKIKNAYSTLSPTEGSREIALRLRELSGLLPLW